jgi:hypothetical protein
MKMILTGNRPSSVAPMQELMRWDTKILATNARVSTFGGTKVAQDLAARASNHSFEGVLTGFNRTASRI